MNVKENLITLQLLGVYISQSKGMDKKIADRGMYAIRDGLGSNNKYNFIESFNNQLNSRHKILKIRKYLIVASSRI